MSEAHVSSGSNLRVTDDLVDSVLRDDDEEDGEKAAKRLNNKSMLSFFSASAGSDDQSRQTHRFFTDRRLRGLSSL